MPHKNEIQQCECSHDFPKTGFVRLAQILGPKGPIPVSRSAFWAGVKAGIYPAPVKLSPRVTCWRAEAILEFIERKSGV